MSAVFVRVAYAPLLYHSGIPGKKYYSSMPAWVHGCKSSPYLLPARDARGWHAAPGCYVRPWQVIAARGDSLYSHGWSLCNEPYPAAKPAIHPGWVQVL